MRAACRHISIQPFTVRQIRRLKQEFQQFPPMLQQRAEILISFLNFITPPSYINSLFHIVAGKCEFCQITPSTPITCVAVAVCWHKILANLLQALSTACLRTYAQSHLVLNHMLDAAAPVRCPLESGLAAFFMALKLEFY